MRTLRKLDRKSNGRPGPMKEMRDNLLFLNALTAILFLPSPLDRSQFHDQVLDQVVDSWINTN